MTKISERLIRFKTPYNYDHESERYESNNVILDPETGELMPMPSCTIPNQTVSIKEIVDRTRKGQIITGALKAVFNPEDDMPDPRTLDFVERKEMAQKLEAELAEINKRQAEREAVKAAKKRQEKEDWKLFQAHLNKMKEGDKPPVSTNTP